MTIGRLKDTSDDRKGGECEMNARVKEKRRVNEKQKTEIKNCHWL